MSRPSPPSIKALFLRALEIASKEREAFLAEACRQDAVLRAQVLELLALHEGSPRFLAAPTTPGIGAESPPEDGPPAEGAGAQVGAYELVELLGEGGFGSVWLAEQHAPVRRRVALKLIKLGMDTRQVIARFEAERQALASMDHPHIARVLDAGATRSGRPYFVMELVQGASITLHCDERRLGLRERLELFVLVCRAVQHAHHKGLVHRDLKPSNVLVATVDGASLPKVIDFGIAKAMHAGPSGQTQLTEERQLVGTPECMSPEQADPGSADVDTRTDVYGLGVLLYELLTGTLPFEPWRLRGAGLTEIQRIIREEDPPAPSARLARLESLPEVAAARRSDPVRLVRGVRGDLDWIVLRCLEKDRARRYQTADGLAQDVLRHLRGQPVSAAPPSLVYGARKLLRRHRTVVLAGLAVFLVLLAGIAGTTTGMLRAIAEAERAEREADRARSAEADVSRRSRELERVADFQSSQLSEIDVPAMGRSLRAALLAERRAALGREGLDPEATAAGAGELEAALAGVNFTSIALEALDRHVFQRALEALERDFGDQPAVEAALLQSLASTMRALGLVQRAAGPLARALELRQNLAPEHSDTLGTLAFSAIVLKDLGRLPEAEERCREALEARRRALGDEHPDTLASVADLALIARLRGRPAEAESLAREALAGQRRSLGEDHPSTLISQSNLASLLQVRGELDESEELYRDALLRHRRVLGERHPKTLILQSNFSGLLAARGELAEAERHCRAVLEARRELLGDDHPSTLISVGNLGALLREQEKLEEAARYHEEALATMTRVLGESHPRTLLAAVNLVLLDRARDRPEEAERRVRDVLAKMRRGLDPTSPEIGQASVALGLVLSDRGAFAEALELLEGAVERGRRAPARGPGSGAILSAYGRSLGGLGRFAEAEAALLEASALLPMSAAAPGREAAAVLARLAELYEAWHAAEPQAGHDARAAEWRARWSAVGAPAPAAPPR